MDTGLTAGMQRNAFNSMGQPHCPASPLHEGRKGQAQTRESGHAATSLAESPCVGACNAGRLESAPPPEPNPTGMSNISSAHRLVESRTVTRLFYWLRCALRLMPVLPLS